MSQKKLTIDEIFDHHNRVKNCVCSTCERVRFQRNMLGAPMQGPSAAETKRGECEPPTGKEVDAACEDWRKAARGGVYKIIAARLNPPQPEAK